MTADYVEFLKRKIPRAEVCGFEPPSEPAAALSPHARDIAAWMVRGGRRACFAAFGLHKTRIQLQVAKWVTEQTGGRFLIVAPLGVKQEFTKSDGPAMGMAIDYVRNNDEVRASKRYVVITNYERVRDGQIDLSQFVGASLDESSVLRSFGSKTYQEFLKLFKDVKYRFVATATPSPNRYKELIHYAGFLGIMDTGEALTRFFQRDSTQANNLTLYPHMEKQFWLWMASWSVFIERPSDLGHSDEGYVLPEMKVHWHKIEVDHRQAWSQVDSWGQAQLLRDDAQGLREGAAIKRDSIDLRVQAAKNIVSHQPMGKHWIIWHDLEAEREALEKTFRLGKSVYGNQELEEREDLIMGFTAGGFKTLLTKPSICGSGCNFQRHCADAVFLGVGYKFNDFIQAIHRLYRFGQKRVVNIHILYLASESSIRDELERKWKRHKELMAVMTELLRKYRLALNNSDELIRTLGCDRKIASSRN